jgi:hypothetical protein
VIFLQTTAAIIFQPKKFFRALATRSDTTAARRFAMVHWGIASVLLGIAEQVHATWFLSLGAPAKQIHAGGLVLLIVACFGFFWLTTRLASMLTAWEARYRGIRLPPRVVRRGLYYHAAHYLPVAVAALITVVGYVFVLCRVWPRAQLWSTGYLYVLCGEVVVAAGYLFNTYWIGMRNMMYANR